MKFIPVAVMLLYLTQSSLTAPLNNEDPSGALAQHGDTPGIQSLDPRSTNEAHGALTQLEARAPRCINRAIELLNLRDSSAVY